VGKAVAGTAQAGWAPQWPCVEAAWECVAADRQRSSRHAAGGLGSEEGQGWAASRPGGKRISKHGRPSALDE